MNNRCFVTKLLKIKKLLLEDNDSDFSGKKHADVGIFLKNENKPLWLSVILETNDLQKRQNRSILNS